MNDKTLKTALYTATRKNGDFLNVYIEIDGRRFELVPHCRTIREKAYFYAMLKKTDLPKRD